MIAPKHLRKLMMGGGGELESQNVTEEGGQKRKDIGVAREATPSALGDLPPPPPPRPVPWSSQRRRRKDLRRWKTDLALVH